MSTSQSELQLQKFRKALTLQLFSRSGPFWDAIREERERWHIDEPLQHVPMRQEELELMDARVPQPGETDSDPAAQLWRAWTRSLMTLHDRAIPFEIWPFRIKYASFLNWQSFLAQCLLFDPPPLRLLEFAHVESSGVAGKRGNASQAGSRPSVGVQHKSPGSSGNPHHPDLVYYVDADQVMRLERAFWRAVLDELGQRFLAPQGIDLESALEETLRETSLFWDYGAALLQIPTDVLISVSSETTLDDVISAFQLLAAQRATPAKVGHPSIDALTAVECANRKDAGWTHVQISEHFGFPMSPDSYGKHRRANSAIAHVKRGQAILGMRENSPE